MRQLAPACASGASFCTNSAGQAGWPVKGTLHYCHLPYAATVLLCRMLSSRRCAHRAACAARSAFAAPAAGLANTNLFDVAASNGATVWDTSYLNPSPLGSSAKLPCYKAGSPVGNYLGGDAAYMMNAWGNGRLAGARPPACVLGRFVSSCSAKCSYCGRRQRQISSNALARCIHAPLWHKPGKPSMLHFNHRCSPPSPPCARRSRAPTL